MKKMIASGMVLLLLLLSGVTTAFAAENMEETPSGMTKLADAGALANSTEMEVQTSE